MTYGTKSPRGDSIRMSVRLVVDNSLENEPLRPSRTEAVQEVAFAMRSFQAVMRQHCAGQLSEKDALTAFYGIIDHDEMNAALEIIERNRQPLNF